ncbi:MAG: HPr family phosphocarrier protein [Phycisphaerales bacterium]|nr:HPr family phosphocarrier protein [Phycisphaerales bacterium]
MSSCERVTIINRLGMHARPAMLLAETAQQFESKISIRRTDQTDTVDAKSIMQLMMLAATEGTELEIKASGPDAEASVRQLVDVVQTGFDED